MRNPPKNRFLDWVEQVGNRRPDPAMHFMIALALVWVLSALLAPVDCGLTDPRTGAPLRVVNQLSPAALVRTMEDVVPAYVAFPPRGVILVMALGAGVAGNTGLAGAALQRLLEYAPARLLTPMLLAGTILGAVAGSLPGVIDIVIQGLTQ